jgi:dolichol-phosphate mannosyltransferase
MKTVAVIPTFNEKENIASLIKDILDLGLDISILVVDDNSPDGTGDIVDRLADEYPQVRIMHRYAQKGRGTAGIAGFQKALAMSADYIIEMDADFSHQPKYIPDMLRVIQECDVVIGSRGIKGGSETGRNPFRTMITRMGNSYIRWLLGLKVRDCTSGFRCFRREVLEIIPLSKLTSTGPSIVEEILYHCDKHGFRMKEVPIIFQDRKKGKSSLTFSKLLQTFFMLHKIKLSS